MNSFLAACLSFDNATYYASLTIVTRFRIPYYTELPAPMDCCTVQPGWYQVLHMACFEAVTPDLWGNSVACAGAATVW